MVTGLPSRRGRPCHSNQVPVRSEELPRRKRMEVKFLTAGQNAASSLVNVICSTRGLKAAAHSIRHYRAVPCLYSSRGGKAVAKYPIFNAFYEDSKAHYYEAVNIGVAIDAGRGLKGTRAGECRPANDRRNKNGSRKLHPGLSR